MAPAPGVTVLPNGFLRNLAGTLRPCSDPDNCHLSYRHYHRVPELTT